MTTPRAAVVTEFWFRTRMRAFPRPVVVLDVSAAAAPLWPVLLSTLEGVAEALPSGDRPDVTFLGSADRVPLDRFLADADALHAANRGRGRVAGPLLDSFAAAWPGRVVLLASRPVADLADWAGTPHAGRLAVVRADPTVSVAGGVCPEFDLSDVESVARLVRPPAARVRLTVAGGFPVMWDAAARFDAGGLVSDGADVRAGFLAESDAPTATAQVVRADGTADPLDAEPTDPPGAPGWLPFTPAELTALDAWRGGRPAHCPACGADHPPGTVGCRAGGLLPSLRGLPGGFVRVRVKMFEASYQAGTRPTAVRSDGAVAVLADGTLAVWRFDVEAGAWRPTVEPWRPFERLGDDFAVLLGGPP